MEIGAQKSMIYVLRMAYFELDPIPAQRIYYEGSAFE
jgi:hypothetical protein